ncbi:hypothetical protein CA54_39170 [Symmachiella macrocystis]|uniref:Uncharacterized protein n=1 Tax=Symmachiella macrocystis TaxID=2527985 RepID=A0A5C6BB57_9PLAN|nr:hypothetical protein [Symmachiella macrocystis]TWU08681.1 hypothetical protein CA54_39170 [Symmachiella macrocystis]
MKNLGDMLKGKNIKAFFVNHGEKIGAACVAVIILIALVSTDWSRDERTPAELDAEISDAKTKIAQSNWPAEKQEEVPLQDFLGQAESLVANMNIAPYEYRVPFIEPLVKPLELITDTKWGAVEELVAKQGVFLMELSPEQAAQFPDQLAAGTGRDVEGDATDSLDLSIKRRKDRYRRRGASSTGKGRNDDDDDGVNLNIRGRRPNGQRLGGYSNESRNRGRGSRGNRLGDDYEDVAYTQARGQRFAAVRGLFNVRQQRLNLARALRLPLPSDADRHLEFRGFRIQRQRAVPGENPWKEENWEELDIEEAVRVLADASGFALPILDPRVTNHYITMPLPPRLEGYWTEEATHPRLEQFKLTDEEREQLENMITSLREQADELQRNDDSKKGGFSELQMEISELRNRATEEQMKKLRDSADQSPKTVGDRVKEIFGLEAPQAGGAYTGLDITRGGGSGRGRGLRGRNMLRGRNEDDDDGDGRSRFGLGRGRGGRNVRQRMATNRQRNMLDVLDDPLQTQGIQAAIGRVLLFRYLDFTVKPGEAYRYRVKLIFNNPAFQAYEREQVDDEAVIQGETRESDWSEPSEVVVIPPDTHAFVANATIGDAPGRNGANFEIYQWHQELGTVINDKMRVIFGQFLGGTKNTLVLNLAKPSFESELATFTSSMALVDASEEPTINLADHPDLKAALGNRRGVRTDRETAIGIPSEALVVREDGSAVRLDSLSQESERERLEGVLTNVRKQYEDLKDTGDDDRGFATGGRGKDRGRGSDRGSNALRKGRRGRR